MPILLTTISMLVISTSADGIRQLSATFATITHQAVDQERSHRSHEKVHIKARAWRTRLGSLTFTKYYGTHLILAVGACHAQPC